jgi:AraC-like DNA-binding protein/ABC-type glycerol-3-phosphate transport system substrate-binding protein
MKPPAVFCLPGLEKVLTDSLPRGTCALVLGSFGTGKTILGLQFLAEGAMVREKGAYVSLRKPQPDIAALHRNMAWDLAGLVRRKMIQHYSWDDPKVAGTALVAWCRSRGIKRLVFDGLSVANPERSRDVPGVLAALQQAGTDVLVLYGAPAGQQTQTDDTEKLGFLCEVAIRLHCDDTAAGLQRTLAVFKGGVMGTARRTPFTISSRGIAVTGKVGGASAIGLSRRTAVTLLCPYSLLGYRWQAYLEEMAAIARRKFKKIDFRVQKENNVKCKSLLARKQNDILLFLMPLKGLTRQAREGLLQPLDDMVTAKKQERFFAQTLSACRYGQGLYGVPKFIDEMNIYANRHLLARHGFDLPRSWDELIGQAQHILAREDRQDLRGILVMEDDLDFLFLEYLWGLGGDIFDAHGAITLNNAQGLRALRFIRQLFADPRLAEHARADAETLMRFFSGQGIFLYHSSEGSVWGRDFFTVSDDKTGVCRLYDAQPDRRHTGIIVGNAICIPRHTRHPQLAAEVLEIFMDPAIDEKIFKKTGFSCGLSAYRAFVGRPDVHAQPFNTVMEHGFTLAEIESYADVHGHISREITRMIEQGTDPVRTCRHIYERFWLCSRRKKYHTLAEQAAVRIEGAYDQDISIQDIARDLHISYPHLYRLFKVVKECTCKEYLLRVRMEHARELLGRDDTPIHQVARQVGYPDPYVFSKIFKKKNGVSPQEYRLTRLRPDAVI